MTLNRKECTNLTLLGFVPVRIEIFPFIRLGNQESTNTIRQWNTWIFELIVSRILSKTAISTSKFSKYRTPNLIFFGPTESREKRRSNRIKYRSYWSEACRVYLIKTVVWVVRRLTWAIIMKSFNQLDRYVYWRNGCDLKFVILAFDLETRPSIERLTITK